MYRDVLLLVVAVILVCAVHVSVVAGSFKVTTSNFFNSVASTRMAALSVSSAYPHYVHSARVRTLLQSTGSGAVNAMIQLLSPTITRLFLLHTYLIK